MTRIRSIARKGSVCRALRSVAALIALIFVMAGCDAKTPSFFSPLDPDGLPRAGIVGTVILDNVIGLPGITVTRTGGRTRVTDGSGDYQFVPLDPGLYTISISNIPEGIFCPVVQKDATVPPSKLERVDFLCESTGAIVGKVTLDGVPLPDVPITLTGPVGGSAITDSLGDFEFADLPPGSYVVTASPTAPIVCVPGSHTPVVKPRETERADFACTLFGTITGSATLDGEPYPGLTVVLATSPVRSTQTDSLGQFSFLSVPAGDVTVILSNLPTNVDCTPLSHDVTVIAAGAVNVLFECQTVATPPPPPPPPPPTDPTGDFVISYTETTNSCMTPPLADDTGTVTLGGGGLTLVVTHNPLPIVGPYDPTTGAFDGETGWTGFNIEQEINEFWDVTFTEDSPGMIAFTGTVTIQRRIEGTGALFCTIQYMVVGTST